MATAEATGTGVSFALTEEQRALRDLAHEFAEKEIRPVAAEYDEHQTHPATGSAKATESALWTRPSPKRPGAGGPGGSVAPRSARNSAGAGWGLAPSSV